MKKLLKIVTILLMSHLLLLSSCQNDDQSDKINKQDAGFSIQRENFKRFKDLPDLISKNLGEAFLENHAKGGNTNPLYNFEIDSTSVTQIINNGQAYYTMEIFRENGSSASFENLVISSNDNVNTAHIFKYTPTEEYVQNLQTNPHTAFIGEINITTLDYNQLMGKNSSDCYTVKIAYCGNGPGSALAGSVCYDSHDAATHINTITFRICPEESDVPIFVNNDQYTSGGTPSLGGPTNPIGGGPSNPTPIYTEPIGLFNLSPFVKQLTTQQKWTWGDLTNATRIAIINFLELNQTQEGTEYATSLLDYLTLNDNSSEAVEKVNTILDFIDDEVIYALNDLEFENENELIEVSLVLIFAQENNYFNQNLDSNFFSGINSYTQVEVIDPVMAMNFARLFLAQCAIIKQENPTWSNYKIFAQAYLDTMHMLLDFAGLVPVIGEVADITNGTIYLIEGQGVNASLSYLSAIPIAGWFSAGIKFAKRADGLKFLVVGTNNLITFGATNSKKFRAVCGIAVGDATKQAHHILPRGSQIIEHEVVQRAAQANVNQGFHIDQALNGIAVATWRNQFNHNAYNNIISQKLINFLAENPNATPQHCYTFLTNLIQQAKQAIINNPNVHLNNLNF